VQQASNGSVLVSAMLQNRRADGKKVGDVGYVITLTRLGPMESLGKNERF
jgi:hypothetical protein